MSNDGNKIMQFQRAQRKRAKAERATPHPRHWRHLSGMDLLVDTKMATRRISQGGETR
jgi:hypothetical protein